MKIAKLIFLLIMGIVIQAEAACSPRQSSECKEFFVKSFEEQEAVFPALPLNKQLEIYRCGMHRKPPAIGLAYKIAKGGDKIIPELIGALRSEKEEWMQSAIIDVFRVMSIEGYLKDKEVIQEIRETVSRMKVSRLKKEAEASLKEIELNANKNDRI